MVTTNDKATGTSSSPSVLTDAVLSSLQEIIDAWEKDSFDKVVEGCTALLKRKKAMNSLGLVEPLQRLWFQSLIEQSEFSKLISTVDMVKGPADLDTPLHLQDLVLYARYRQGEHGTVSKQVTAQAKAAKTDAAAAAASAQMNDSDDHSSLPVLSQHLAIQSQFHLNQTRSALEGYREMLSNLDTDDDDDDDDGYTNEQRFQLLTNALAVIASSSTIVVPYVGLDMTTTTTTKDDGDGGCDETVSFLMNEAERLLLQDGIHKQEDEFSTSTNSDLSTNLGMLHFLTDQSSPTQDWLQIADSLTGNDDTDTSTKTNLAWRRHFWYRDVDDVAYPSTGSSSSSSTKQLTVPQSVVKVNQALLQDQLRNIPPQPHPKWNQLQGRMYWYNRAVLQYNAKQYVECQESCRSLEKFLLSSRSGASGSNPGINNRRKKNKAPNASSSAGTEGTKVPSTSSSSSADLWWETRSDVVMAHAQHKQSKTRDALKLLDERMEKLREANGTDSTSKSNLVLDNATAYVQLHQFIIEHGSISIGTSARKSQELVTLLKALPSSIQSRPAVQLTLDDLESVATSSTGGTNLTPAKKSPLEEADIAFHQGRYQDACNLYQDNLELNNSSQDEDDAVDRQLRYIQALSLTGQFEKSVQLAESLSTELDGVGTTFSQNASTLESKGLPRNMTGVVKNIVAPSNESNHDVASSDSPSREKILRRRARKREQYLNALERKGLFNPDRPTKPNPERWTPKHERSRSRGGGGRNRNNAGNNRSQGGGSQRDALKLDAAARKAGTIPANTGPSTANIKVGGGGRKGGKRR